MATILFLQKEYSTNENIHFPQPTMTPDLSPPVATKSISTQEIELTKISSSVSSSDSSAIHQETFPDEWAQLRLDLLNPDREIRDEALDNLEELLKNGQGKTLLMEILGSEDAELVTEALSFTLYLDEADCIPFILKNVGT